MARELTSPRGVRPRPMPWRNGGLRAAWFGCASWTTTSDSLYRLVAWRSSHVGREWSGLGNPDGQAVDVSSTSEVAVRLWQAEGMEET